MALFFPTIVSGAVIAMFVEPEVNAPLMTTTGLEPDLARPTPFWTLHTGACAVPALLSLHVAPPRVPTYTVSASVAQWPSLCLMHTPGPMAEHSLSAVQARQVFVAVAQMGVAPEQVVLSVHWTQAPPLPQAR